MTKEKLAEVAEKVAQLLAENQVTFSDVSRVFCEAEYHLTVTCQSTN